MILKARYSPELSKRRFSSRIRQMDRGDTTQGLGNPGENVDSYFHPLPSSLFSVQTRQALEIEGKFASSTKKRQSHLANPGSVTRHSPDCGCLATRIMPLIALSNGNLRWPRAKRARSCRSRAPKCCIAVIWAHRHKPL